MRKKGFHIFFTALWIIMILCFSSCTNGMEPSGTPSDPTHTGTKTVPPEAGADPFTVTYIATVGGKVNGQDVAAVICNGTETTATATAKADEGFSFICWSDGNPSPARNDAGRNADAELKAYFAKNTTVDFNAVYLYTDDGTPVMQKEYESMYGLIKSADGITEISGQIKGRGNSSWDEKAAQDEYASKNSYKLKLDSKMKLFGIGDSKNKDWVLNSNKFDASQLRNYFFWQLADKMDTIPYVPDCSWAELYVNGEYRGLYMVSEFVEAANDRVEISETVAEGDPSFLVETDYRGNRSDDPYFYIDGYGPNPKEGKGVAIEFVVKSELTEDSELQEIKTYLENCHHAILSGSREAMEALIDMPSLIDMYIIEELGKDIDMGKASFYLQREMNGKMYFTAPWDFDFSIGTYQDAKITTGLISYQGSGCVWYAALVEQPWFREEVKKRLDEVKPMFLQAIRDMKSKSQEIRAAADYSNHYWKVYGNQYHKYIAFQVSKNLHSYEDHINFIENWLLARWNSFYEIFSTGNLPE